MDIIVCYKNFKIGKLSFDGKDYIYKSLKDSLAFNKEYGFIDYPLAKVDNERFKEIPHFFSTFVDVLIHNIEMSSKLDINLNTDSYFDILYRYAKLPQIKNTFYYVAK